MFNIESRRSKSPSSQQSKNLSFTISLFLYRYVAARWVYTISRSVIFSTSFGKLLSTHDSHSQTEIIQESVSACKVHHISMNWPGKTPLTSLLSDLYEDSGELQHLGREATSGEQNTSRWQILVGEEGGRVLQECARKCLAKLSAPFQSQDSIPAPKSWINPQSTSRLLLERTPGGAQDFLATPKSTRADVKASSSHRTLVMF